MLVMMEFLTIAVVSVLMVVILQQFALHESVMMFIVVVVGLLSGRLVRLKSYARKEDD